MVEKARQIGLQRNDIEVRSSSEDKEKYSVISIFFVRLKYPIFHIIIDMLCLWFSRPKDCTMRSQ